MESRKNDRVVFGVCRPTRLTCLWLQDTTRSISNICKQDNYCVPFSIKDQCNRQSSSQDLEKLWKIYQSDLQKTQQCFQHKNVQRVLLYERDYKDFL
jgi:hypothetical protein